MFFFKRIIFIHTSSLFFIKLNVRILAMGKKKNLSVSVDLSPYSFLTFPEAYFYPKDLFMDSFFILFFYFLIY